MADRGVDVLLLSVGADLPYFCGYEAMPLERLTMLVVPRDGDVHLVVPHLEAPRVVERPEVFDLVTWRVKDADEVEALRRAGAAVDRILADVQAGQVPLVGRTEADVAAQIGRRILDEGHHRINFVIVASGPNAASPHHEPGGRVIGDGEGVLFDIGGTMVGPGDVGYCSAITRCVHIGPPPDGFAELYGVLHASQTAGVAEATVGTPCEDVDAAARRVIVDAGHGEHFVHRTGHGIGVEAHEHPNIVAGTELPLAVGHAFSVEPGIYVPGVWGARLEDIVVATADGPVAMNQIDRSLAVVEG